MLEQAVGPDWNKFINPVDHYENLLRQWIGRLKQQLGNLFKIDTRETNLADKQEENVQLIYEHLNQSSTSQNAKSNESVSFE